MEKELQNSRELDLHIQQLEARQRAILTELENSATGVLEGLQPANLIKNSLAGTNTLEAIFDLLKNSLLTAGSGFLSSKIFGRQKGRPLRRVLGSAAVLGLTKLLMNNPALVQAGIGFMTDLINNIRTKKAAASAEQPE